MSQLPAPAFIELQEQIIALRNRPETGIRAGHIDMGSGVWMSCDPKGQATMTCAPEGESFRLEWNKADTGRWACVGLALPIEIIARGRYFGLRLEAVAHTPLICTPCLRYHFKDKGMQDAGLSKPVFIPKGPRTHFMHIPINVELLERSKATEVNIFLQSDSAEVSIFNLEPIIAL